MGAFAVPKIRLWDVVGRAKKSKMLISAINARRSGSSFLRSFVWDMEIVFLPVSMRGTDWLTIAVANHQQHVFLIEIDIGLAWAQLASKFLSKLRVILGKETS